MGRLTEIRWRWKKSLGWHLCTTVPSYPVETAVLSHLPRQLADAAAALLVAPITCPRAIGRRMDGWLLASLGPGRASLLIVGGIALLVLIVDLSCTLLLLSREL